MDGFISSFILCACVTSAPSGSRKNIGFLLNFFLCPLQSLFEGITALSNPTSLPAPNIESDQTWSQLLPLSVSDLEVSLLHSL